MTQKFPVKTVRISQKQIAKDLGVSQTLVSMVLNGRQKGISKSAYEKIWHHARRSGYRPKGIATELLMDSTRTKAVGLMLRSGATLYSQSPFFGHVQHGIHDFLKKKGIALHFLGIENELDADHLKELRDPDTLLGLVILGEVSRPFLQALLKLDSRIVTVSCQYPGLCDSVVSNEEQAADLLVQHLMELGHKNFAWVGGNRGSQRSKQRLMAIQSALHLRNASIDPKYCVDAESGDRLEGQHMAEALLQAAEGGKMPTAWICFNGTMARGVVNYVTGKGLAIPDDISIAAFDQTRVCEDEHPTLTSASTSPELLGRVAAELLLENKDKDKTRFTDTVLSVEFVARESTGKVRVAQKQA